MFEIADKKYVTYHTWQTGDFFGLEDYIYRMPEKERSALVDRQMSFCHYKITVWDKRQFTPQAIPEEDGSEPQVFMFNMWEHLAEWQERFPFIANELFAESLNSLRDKILRRRIRVMEKMLDARPLV